MRERPTQTLTCYCCHGTYERGKFRCCAPPSGMATFRWQEQFCRVEIAEGKRCNTCPRCGCAHRPAMKFTGTDIGWSSTADLSPKTRGALRAAVTEWMPFKESREVGEEG